MLKKISFSRFAIFLSVFVIAIYTQTASAQSSCPRVGATEGNIYNVLLSFLNTSSSSATAYLSYDNCTASSDTTVNLTWRSCQGGPRSNTGTMILSCRILDNGQLVNRNNLSLDGSMTLLSPGSSTYGKEVQWTMGNSQSGTISISNVSGSHSYTVECLTPGWMGSNYYFCNSGNISVSSINAQCGTAARTYNSNETSFSLPYCSVGTVNGSDPSFPAAGSSSSWTCNGTGGGAQAGCTAYRNSNTPPSQGEQINGTCGAAQRTYSASETSFDLPFCNTGNLSGNNPSFPAKGSTATWSCLGSNGGTTVSCSAYRSEDVPPVAFCGNNTIDSGEQCDGSAAGSCTNGCNNSTCQCLPAAYCGNNAIEGSEQCDNTNLGSCSWGCSGLCQCLLDTIPPRTIAYYNGSRTILNWYTGDVQVSLQATDNLSGVQETRICIDQDNTCTPSTGTTGTVTFEGTSYVRYFSIDRAGNIEATHSDMIRIDKTPPDASADNANPGSWYNPITRPLINITAYDALSGLAGTNYTWDDSNFSRCRSQGIALNPSPIANWHLDETSGDSVADSSGNGHSGTASGPSIVDGNSNKARNFINETDVININDSTGLDLTDNFKIEAWVNRTDDNGYTMGVVTKYNEGEGGGYALMIGRMGEVYCSTLNNAGERADSYSDYDDPRNILPGTGWHKIAAERIGSTCRVYIDDVEATSVYSNHDEVGVSTATLQIGGGINTYNDIKNFMGMIDEVKIYDFVPSNGQAVALTKSPIALWHMDESTGQVASDSSGSGSDGQLGSSSGADSEDPTWNTADPKYGSSALSFDGVDDEVIATDSTNLKLTDEMTVEAWVKGQGASLNETQRVSSSANRGQPQIQVVGNKVYVVWTDYNGASSNIWFASMNTDGTGWTAVQQANSGGYSIETPHFQVVGDKVYYVFNQTTNGSQWGIYTAVSNLDGSGWTQTLRTTARMTQQPQLQVVGSKIYYFFRDRPSTTYVLYTASMNIDGTGWTSTQQTSVSNPEFLQQQVVGDKIYYVYRDIGSKNLYTANMNTDGTDWLETQQTFSGGVQMTQLQVVGDKIYYVYIYYSGGVNQIVLASTNLDGSGFSSTNLGGTFYYNTTSFDITNIQFQIVGNKIYYTWVARDGSYNQLYTASSDLNGSNWSANRKTTSSYNKYFPQLQVVGGKIYYIWCNNTNSIWTAFEGSNVINKGDFYGIGITGNTIKGFANGGMDTIKFNAQAISYSNGAVVESTIDSTSWHHVVAAFDGSKINLYIDGSLIGSMSQSMDISTNSFSLSNYPLIIGDSFSGSIDEAKIYDTALTASEVSNLYNNNTEIIHNFSAQINIIGEGRHNLYLCATDNAGWARTWTGEYNLDITAPYDGTVAATNLDINGYTSKFSLTLDINRGVDDVSGMSDNNTDYLLEVSSVPLVADTCTDLGNTWSDANIDELANASSYLINTSMSTCYQFRYTVKDKAGNSTTYISNVAKVSNTPSINPLQNPENYETGNLQVLLSNSTASKQDRITVTYQNTIADEIVDGSLKLTVPTEFDLTYLSSLDVSIGGSDVIWETPVVQADNHIIFPFLGALNGDDGLITVLLGNINYVINPPLVGDYQFIMGAYRSNDGSDDLVEEYPANVNITDGVTVSATVPSSLTFSVFAVGEGEGINGTTTTMSSEDNLIDFGIVEPNVVKIAAHDLQVSTNSTNGFIVTIQSLSDFASPNGDKIAPFPGTNHIPVEWSAPAMGDHGHFGYTTEDETLHDTPINRFTGDLWAGATSASEEVMYHHEPIDGIDRGKGLARIGYKIEIDQLQPAGNYETQLMYLCTATY